MTKAVDQQLYDLIFSTSERLGYNTYTHLPPADTRYPFVYIGDTQIVPLATKSYLLGRAYAHIDVWGDRKSRKQVSSMANNLISEISKNGKVEDGHDFSMRFNDSSVSVMPDNSTDDDLWRASIELSFNII